MKKILLSVFIASMTISAANADVTVNFSAAPESSKTVVTYMPLSAVSKSRAERRAATGTDTLNVVNNKMEFPLQSEAAQYSLDFGDASLGFFAAPGENIVIDVKSLNPLDYSMKGTQFVEDMTSLKNQVSPVQTKILEMRKQKDADRDALNALYEEMTGIFKNFITSNPDSPVVPYAAMNLDSEEMINTLDNLSPAAKNSIFMPVAMVQYDSAKKRLEIERKQQALQNGTTDAPGFTLKNLEGKDVSLSDFKGKWVILDFWGTWCPWCIKGFPALKEAYSKYAGKLEIIGIDCGDTEEKWRDGVKQYELPWVQVYKPQDNNQVLDEYFVQAYPTKAIVNPEGKVANITVGENPDFFNILAKLMGE